jgi:structure-specific recognition protein 1
VSDEDKGDMSDVSDIKEVGDLASGASDEDEEMVNVDQRMSFDCFNLVAAKPAKKSSAKVATVKKSSTGDGDKKKGEKKKKDPNAPKKGLSGYMFFVKEKRAEVAAKHPEMAFGDLGKELGRLWKEVTGEEKEVSAYWF